ncbi:MAG: hypothetical protein RL427_196 [Bacteroidota bacterium]|jgi:Leucine-rich repeat (LRR) protein
MKKQYALLLFALIGFYGSAQVVNIPDFMFKIKLLSANATNGIALDSNEQAFTVDANNDGEIQLSEAIQVSSLNLNSSNIIDLTGIQSFTNLRFLQCNSNLLTSLNVSGLNNLEVIDCIVNQIGSINVSGLSNLKALYCNSNQITAIDLSGLSSLESLSCSNNQITALDLSGLTLNFQSLDCSYNELTALDLSGLYELNQLYCNFNSIASLNSNGLTQLNVIECSNNQLTSLNVNGLTSLSVLFCSDNLLTSLNPSGLANLANLNCSNNQITVLPLSDLPSLQALNCSNNQLTSLDASSLSNLTGLACSLNLLSSINVSGLAHLTNLNCERNQLTALNLTGLSSLTSLSCEQNQLTALDFTDLTQLTGISCSNNLLTSLDVSTLSLLEGLLCSNNLLTTLDVSGLSHLTSLECRFNQLTTLNLSNVPLLNVVYANNNQISALDVAASENLQFFLCNDNLLTSLDVSTCHSLLYLYCDNNLLHTLIIKNGTNEDFHISGNPTLEYICADEGFETETIQFLISNTVALPNCHVNSYCSFVPGGAFYALQGTTHFDANANGCDVNDLYYPNFKLGITDGILTSTIIANTSGNYQYEVQAGTQTISPMLENPSYFTVSPATTTVTFPDTTSPYLQDYCIVPNGIHTDLEIALFPIDIARPGFDATYKIIYKNKGTAAQSGTVAFSFDDARLDLVSAIPSVSNTAMNTLTWDFTDLMPFETREVTMVLNINSPIETPAVANGDVLLYTATIAGATDETPVDNTAVLAQGVVNSFDPNDKTCLEGTTITPNMVGNYVHYVIRFENDGTANAQNIVVKDLIDTNKFDVASLIPLSGSASYVTRITNANQVEFVFENINLPFTEGANTGYVAFKIKTKPTLVLDDSFSNTASIFFDYNAPIVTNTATTTVGILANQDFDFSTYFSVYPVPAKQVLNLQIKETIGVKSIAIYNSLGQVVFAIPNAQDGAIDVSALQTGSYFIKLYTDKGTASAKFVKE